MQSDFKKVKAVRDELIDSLEAQIAQQEKIIHFQEETIKILEEQNDELINTIHKMFNS